MSLTLAQSLLIKNAINADPVLNAFPNTGDGVYAIARLLEKDAVPVFTVWKSGVPIGSIRKAFNSSEMGGLTTANTNRLMALAHYLLDGVNPSQASNRAFFDDIFSGAGGTLTRASLAVLWKRPATYIEKILASSAIGTDAAPATLLYEGGITHDEVYIARNLP